MFHVEHCETNQIMMFHVEQWRNYGTNTKI